MNRKPEEPSTTSFPLRSTLLLVGVFFITFIGRSSLSPLLLPIERELGISHAEGGSFFLVISVGLMLTMLFSGLVSQRLKHHTTITLSAVLTGAALILIAAAGNLFWFRVGLFFLGAGAGLYLPSGVTTLTDIVPSGQWGRAIALHELGPIFGLAAAPILADIALPFFNWKVLLLVLGIVSLLVGAVFARYAEGGRFYGTPPQWGELYSILKKRQFWIIAFFFVMAIGLEMGVYSMLPSYLVADRGIDPSLVNRMVSTSRLTALLMIFAAGWLSDHLGYKTVIAGTALISGILTALIGFAHGWLLIGAVYLQPMLVSAFFPAGFTAMAGVSSAAQRNLSVSMVIPIAYLFGGGVFPTLIGWLAEREAFGLGFVVVGILMAAGTLIVPVLEPTRETE